MLIKVHTQDTTLFINLDAVPVIEHVNNAYLLQVPSPGNGSKYCKLEILVKVKKSDDPSTYKIIRKYLKQTIKGKVYKPKIVPLNEV